MYSEPGFPRPGKRAEGICFYVSLLSRRLQNDKSGSGTVPKFNSFK